MSTFTITGDDTLTLYDRVFTDFADDDVMQITFPNDLVAVKTGKNKNTIFSKNETGNNGNLVIRLIRGSSDDRLMRTKLASMEADFASTVLAKGSFIKRLGDGDGNVLSDTYALQGGMITRRVDAKENSSGDTAQAVAVYTMTFALATSSIQ